MAAEDNPYPRWIECPQHLIVQHKGRPHVYDYPYDIARDGKVRILVQSGAQEQGTHLQATATPHIAVKTVKP
jgi:hypothetical protein